MIAASLLNLWPIATVGMGFGLCYLLTWWQDGHEKHENVNTEPKPEPEPIFYEMVLHKRRCYCPFCLYGPREGIFCNGADQNYRKVGRQKCNITKPHHHVYCHHCDRNFLTLSYYMPVVQKHEKNTEEEVIG